MIRTCRLSLRPFSSKDDKIDADDSVGVRFCVYSDKIWLNVKSVSLITDISNCSSSSDGIPVFNKYIVFCGLVHHAIYSEKLENIEDLIAVGLLHIHSYEAEVAL